MNKLTNINTARRNSGGVIGVSTPGGVIDARAWKMDSAWVEFADHIMFEAQPLVSLAVELTKGANMGRVPFRAVLLVAALFI